MFITLTGTDLIYNIVEAQLSGVIDGIAISAYAVSGGRSGSKTAGVVNPFLANNPFATRVKKTSTVPGGPLIMGKYFLKTHETRSNWIRLIPFEDNEMGDRDGFAIHGRGNRGSDGCIVPTDFNVVETLHKLLKKREAAGSSPLTLAVISVGDMDFLENRLKQYSQTA